MGLTKPNIEKLIKENENHYCEGMEKICVKIVAVANLPTIFGNFQVVAFYNNYDQKEHAAFLHRDVCSQENVPVRLHSECLTGDSIGSLRCDCRDQLLESLKFIASQKNGALLYLRQEGRGIGFINKIKAYQLQDFGYDTIEANEKLGFKADERHYGIASHMLNSLNIKSVKLITNNPEKIRNLEEHGIKITGRIPIVIPPNPHSQFYLETKKKMGHLLEEGKTFSLEQEE